MEMDKTSESLADLPASAPEMVWLPTIGYVIFSGFAFLLIDMGSYQMYLFIPFFAACLTTTLYLFYLALRPVPESLRRKNANNNPPAGGQAGQTPQGAFRALCPALGRMVGLHYFCAIVLTNAFNYFDKPNGNEMPLFLFFLNSCPVAALLMGAMLASSMWVLAETSFGRVCAIAGLIFGWIIQYWLIFFLVVSAFRTFGVYTFLVVLMLSLILPEVIVSDAWRAAERKIRKLA